MEAGKLKERVTFQLNTPADNAIGEKVEAWTDFVTLWASVEPLSGKRFWEAKQAQAEVDGIVRVRYYPGITAAQRVKFGTRYLKIQNIVDTAEAGRELLVYYKEIQP